MTKRLTLRQARKLESKIRSYLTGLRYADLDTRLTLDAFDSRDVKDRVIESQEETMNTIGLAEALVSLRFKIRRMIQEKNEEVGINNLVAERKKLDELEDIIDVVLRGVERITVLGKNTTDEALTKRLESIATNTTSTESSVTVAALTHTAITSLEERRRLYTNALEQIEEELNSLNSRTFIELSDNDVECARTAKII